MKVNYPKAELLYKPFFCFNFQQSEDEEKYSLLDDLIHINTIKAINTAEESDLQLEELIRYTFPRKQPT